MRTLAKQRKEVRCRLNTENNTMLSYFFKRLTAALPLLFGISFIAFGLMNLIPGDPAEVALRVNDTPPTQELIEETRIELGLDKPFLVRYFNWLERCLRLDFGVPFVHRDRTVLGEMQRCLPATVKLAMVTLLIIVAVSVPLGVGSALMKGRALDQVVRGLVFIGTAMPNYWVAYLLIWLFALICGLLPVGGSGKPLHYILPAATLSLTYISTYVRLIRNNMLENLNEDYIFYARARGLPERAVISRHALKNSIHSSMTAIAMSIPQLIAGTVVVESIFSWPGLGRLCIEAIKSRDYPIIQAYVLLMGVLFIGCNLIVDCLQAWLDPRLRQKTEE